MTRSHHGPDLVGARCGEGNPRKTWPLHKVLSLLSVSYKAHNNVGRCQRLPLPLPLPVPKDQFPASDYDADPKVLLRRLLAVPMTVSCMDCLLCKDGA